MAVILGLMEGLDEMVGTNEMEGFIVGLVVGEKVTGMDVGKTDWPWTQAFMTRNVMATCQNNFTNIVASVCSLGSFGWNYGNR